MTPPPLWPRREPAAGPEATFDGQDPPNALPVQAGGSSVAAGGDIGAAITGDGNTVTNLYVISAELSGKDGGPRAVTTKPISKCRPLDLEVHHAVHEADELSELPTYVERLHDEQLRKVVGAAASGRSQMCVLVGASSTGKTRACWEAIQVLAADGWELWHPFDPTRGEAALAGLAAVGPKTVVWLNETQLYLADEHAGERIAAALRSLLGDTDRAPVLVLGTLWPEHWDRLTSPTGPRLDHPHAQARQLLAGRHLRVPEAFTAQDIIVAGEAAVTDQRLALALQGSADGRIAQFLAGAPAIMERYSHLQPGARAVLHAAMDARRLGCGTALPVRFLEDAAPGYLSPSSLDALDDDWFEEALAYAGHRVTGDEALLRRVRQHPGSADSMGTCYRLTDYMEQHGRRERRHLCPPQSFWDAALRHLSYRADVSALASAATGRWRLRYGRLLSDKAVQLPWYGLFVEFPRHEPSDGWRYATDDGELDDHLTCRALADMASMAVGESDYEQAADLAMQAGQCCQPDTLAEVALLLEERGMSVEASDLAHEAAAYGSPECLGSLAMTRQGKGLFEQAEHYAHEAARYGLTDFLADLALDHEEAGRREMAEALWEDAARHGHSEALASIARFQHENGDFVGAAQTALEAVDRGDAAYPNHRIQPLWKTLWPFGVEPDGSPSLDPSATEYTRDPNNWW
ncbi:hypothetical protein [Streptomyces gardneri]|uniref:hypothetical protein n=1 Tax=Streptomyces gardneri TaxID=66892 RepID=UPI0033EB8BB9